MRRLMILLLALTLTAGVSAQQQTTTSVEKEDQGTSIRARATAETKQEPARTPATDRIRTPQTPRQPGTALAASATPRSTTTMRTPRGSQTKPRTPPAR
jgi:hypothetical protein